MGWIRKTIGFNDTWLMILGIPIVSFIMSVIMFSRFMVHDFSTFIFGCIPIGLIFTSVFWLSFRPIICWFMVKFPEPKDIAKRLPLQIITILIAYFIIKVTLHYFIHHVVFWDHYEEAKFTQTIGSLLFIALILTIYEGSFFYTKLQRSLQETERLQRQNIQSQLEGLKNQVNPHFLFNSLNTLSHLIPEDSDKAIGFVQKLSKVYRYILEIRDKKIIPISEEIEFLHAYIFLLKERFGENINVQCNVPSQYLDKKIVPLSLQILLENAIKHNIISTNKPLTIEVFIEEKSSSKNEPKLVVKNNLQKKNQVTNSTKMGLENIKNRYQFFTDQPVKIISTDQHFLVMLPLVNGAINEKSFFSMKETV